MPGVGSYRRPRRSPEWSKPSVIKIMISRLSAAVDKPGNGRFRSDTAGKSCGHLIEVPEAGR